MAKGQKAPKFRYRHIISYESDAEISKSVFLSHVIPLFLLLFKGLQAVWPMQLYNPSILKQLKYYNIGFMWLFLLSLSAAARRSAECEWLLPIQRVIPSCGGDRPHRAPLL